MFTDIKDLKIENMRNININNLKEKLAIEATNMLHGERSCSKLLKPQVMLLLLKKSIKKISTTNYFN